MARVVYDNLTQNIPIIGFTGALGSGCSFLAKGLADYRGYDYYKLSAQIRDEAKERGLLGTIEDLQNVGNEFRRERGSDYLVIRVLDKADQNWPQKRDRCVGIVLDGVRNTGEVEALRQFTNFYLVSVQAAQELRRQRLTEEERVGGDEEFDRADKRDAEEKTPFGQQVKRCNDLADIVVLNEENISPVEEEKKRLYIDTKLYNRHVSLIQRIANGQPNYEKRPERREFLMMMAHCASLNSSCLKRKVGAVIARENGQILAVGHNDVPEGTVPCVSHPRYQGCARDKIQEDWARNLRNCPRCGAPIAIEHKCTCGHELREYLKRCPGCRSSVEIDYVCECGARVFEEFLPGGGEGEAGRLLDMCRALHAEETALLSLVTSGVSDLSDAIIYCTTFPCNLCANKIVRAGIRRVVYAEPYPMREAREVFEKSEVKVDRFEGAKSAACFRLYGQA